MAQIIRHRKGVLESVASATKRKAELLVVTGSSTSAIDTGLLFIGTEGGTVTAANKVHTGTITPDLTGASYDTSIDGIPFYNTSEKKYYILKKGGNIEIQATANTGGTGIVSSSAQVDALGFLQVNGDAVVSGSSQITISSTTGYATFSSSLASTDAAQNARLSSIETFTSSLDAGFVNNAELAAATGALESADSAQQARLSALETETGSIATAQGVQDGRLDSIEGFTSSIDSTIKTKLNTETVISGSSQVQLGSVSGFTAYSSSVDSRTAALESAVGAGSNIDGRLTSLETFSGSQEAKDAVLATYTASVDAQLDAIHSYTSSLKTAVSVDGANLTVLGNLEVQGTTTTVDSTTVSIGDNIIELNGAGAANGGLLIKDVTAPNLNSGSLLWDSTNDFWKAGALGAESKLLLAGGDSVVSGSSQITISSTTGFSAFSSSLKATDDAIIAANGVQDGRLDDLESFESGIDSTIKTKLNVETVISGSSQVQLGSVSGFTAYSSSVDSRISNLGDNLDASIKTKLNVENVVSSSAQVVGHLVGQDIATNGISGSSLDITGNAKIDGNLVLGGNITIGDATSDTISFGGEITSDIIPATDNTYDLGSASKKLAQVHATTFFGNVEGNISGVINATNGVISGSAQLLDVATDFGSGRVSGEQFGDVAGTSTFTGSFVGDGSALTGLVTDLRISGSTGDDVVSLLTDDLTFAGGTAMSVAVTDNTITINASDASTSAKGIASFVADDFSVTSGAVSIKDGGVRAINLNADVVGTGLSLDGVDNTIEVDYGATAGTAVEGNTSLTVQGTSNEIEISGGSVTLGAGGTVTIGLPDDVTIGNDLSVTTDLAVGGNAVITGNLSVLGTTTTIDSTTVSIGDNVIELNYGGAQDTAGLLVTDATAPNTASGSLLWNGTSDKWTAGPLGSEKEIARLNVAPTANTVLKADANGLLVDSVMTDDGTDATFSGDVIVEGLAASSFIYSNGSKQLTAITPSNAGDVIQWNGSSFVASNELDGGTF